MEYKTISFGQHKVPEFVEKPASRGWVLNGEDDRYPVYLLELFNRSSVHNALVLGKASYIYGKGFETKDAQAQAFIDKANKYESLNKVLKKCAIDEEIFGGFYLQGIWNNEGTQLAEIYHLPYAKTRSNENNSIFYYSKKLTGPQKVTFRDKSVTEYPGFNINNKTGSQVLFVKNYRPDVETYSLPDSLGANAAIETNIEINNWHLNNIKNGFSGGYLINFKNGAPTEEEKEKIAKDIQKKHTGSDAAGRVVLIFSEGPSDAPDVVPLTPNDLDKLFEQLRKDTNEEIFIGHRVISPMLFGIKTEGQLGGVTELKTSFEIFKSTVIQEKQSAMLEIFNELVYLATGVADSLELKTIPPVKDEISIKDILNDLTPDERRELVGFGPVVKTQETPSMFSRHKKDKQKDLEDFSVFDQFGRVVSDEELKQYTKRDLDFVDEQPVLYMFDKLSDIEKKALSIAKDNPNIETGELAEALKIDADEAKELLKGLSKKDLLWINKQSNVKITQRGESVVENIDLPEFDIVYRYEKSPYAQGPSILPGGRTRDFCEQMIRANKVFTRQEIDQISERVGYNVWKFRGGWLTTPDGEHTPYCRHVWVQYVIRKKK